MKVMIITDAWAPQVNGVVRTLEVLGRELCHLGHEVRYVTPEGRFTVPMPTYSEIRLAIFAQRTLENEIRDFAPDAIHIATEGTLGIGARKICVRYNIPFTTSFHTRFPEYVTARFPFIREEAVYRFLRWFHAPATAMMVATPALRDELEERGFKNLKIWSRGVDTDLFKPMPGFHLPYSGPVFLYVGRIAVEKNIESFLKLDLPGTKVLVGDGPARATLAKAYPEAVFLGPKSGQELVECYAGSDVFVFPSKTDTFGLVMLEAAACGTPVAAYPVQGPNDVIGGFPGAGVLDDDLEVACKKALELSREGAREFALSRSWRSCTEQFLSNLAIEAE
ncbi:glycosyltransferase [Rhizomicrobium palustre]|uniref:glycosyltransferase n=1 Tax=Rhizomicrobium palustre TaxID=189966 RepID=UPI00141F5435